MEVKINREIRNYTEAVFFGLSLRQLFFSILAIIVSVLVFFLLRGKLSTEIISWLCIMCAAPFAALGFVTYNGMNAEDFALAFIKYILTPKNLKCESTNIYYEALKDNLKERRQISD